MKLIHNIKSNLTDKSTHVPMPLEVKYAVHNITGKMVLKLHTLHQYSFTICKLVTVTDNNYFSHCTFYCDIYSLLSCTNSVISRTFVAEVSFF